MIIRQREQVGAPVSGAMLKSVVAEHMRGLPRLLALKAAYQNKREILDRKRGLGQPNNRLAHGFARYIATMASGYLIGEPVTYQAEAGQEAALQAVTDAYTMADVQSVDAELAKEASVYGRGVELLFADDQARPRTASLPPESAFVVYDDTVEGKPLFGVHIVQKARLDGALDGYQLTVYDAANAYEYRVSHLDALNGASPVSVTPHFFSGVPMVEYWNNEDETGDFEQVQTLIDAYDVLQSDRVNDKQQFVDALLIITGATMENDANGRTPGQQLREDKVLMLPDSECRAEYLSKAMSESDVEVLKDSLKSDIHKFSMVPDLTDEQFSGNSSGVAMKYKLLGLEQLTKIKERWFREALRERLRRFAAFLSVKGAPTLNADSATMTFTRSLPVNEAEEAQTFSTYAGTGKIPDEILLAHAPIVSDAQEAVKQLKQQREADAKRQKDAFGGAYDVPSGKDEEKE